MKLSLSARIIEEARGKFQMSLVAFLDFAKEIGYQGVELRQGQYSAETAPDEADRMKRRLEERNLRCAFIRASNVEERSGLETFKLYLSIARVLKVDVVRFRATETLWAKRAADLAAERGLRLASQIHTRTRFETVDMALESLKEIERENFGVIFEPANLILAGEDYGPEAIQRLGDKIFAVSVQNIKPVNQPQGEHIIEYKGRSFARCLIGDPEGVDFSSLFQGLKAIGYQGFVNVLEPKSHLMDNLELARFAYEKLREFMD
jgi:sugar phosphate isomerase/epimerase